MQFDNNSPLKQWWVLIPWCQECKDYGIDGQKGQNNPGENTVEFSWFLYITNNTPIGGCYPVHFGKFVLQTPLQWYYDMITYDINNWLSFLDTHQ